MHFVKRRKPQDMEGVGVYIQEATSGEHLPIGVAYSFFGGVFAERQLLRCLSQEHP